MSKDRVATLHVLQAGLRVSVESMRCHPIARGLTSELVAQGGPLVERDARILGRQIGLAV